jgi:hypothetical protein
MRAMAWNRNGFYFSVLRDLCPRKTATMPSTIVSPAMASVGSSSGAATIPLEEPPLLPELLSPPELPLVLPELVLPELL